VLVDEVDGRLSWLWQCVVVTLSVFDFSRIHKEVQCTTYWLVCNVRRSLSQWTTGARESMFYYVIVDCGWFPSFTHLSAERRFLAHHFLLHPTRRLCFCRR